MAVGEYVRCVVRFWWVVAIVTLAFAVAAGAYGAFVQPVQYVSTARLFVAAEGGTSVGESYQNNLFAESRVNSYAEVAVSDQVAERASQILDHSISTTELRESTAASPIENTVILQISVTSPSAAHAQSGAAAVARATVQVVQELETSRRGGEPAATAVLYDEASMPGAPTGTPWWLMAIGGAILGLLAGLALAVLFGIRDRRRVGGSDASSEIAEFPLLAAIPDSSLREQSTMIVDFATDTQGDAYRLLRNRLRFGALRESAGGTAPQVVAIIGVEPDVGSSTVAINLSSQLGAVGDSVLLIDGDLRAGSVSAAVGVGDSEGRTEGLTSVLLAHNSFEHALVSVGPMAVLGTGPSTHDPGEVLGSRALPRLLAEARTRFDHVVIDAGTGDNLAEAELFAGLADCTVVVVRRRRTTRSRLRALVSELDRVGSVIGTVLTFAPAPQSAGALKVRPQGLVPDDDHVTSDSTDPEVESPSVPGASR